MLANVITIALGAAIPVALGVISFSGNNDGPEETISGRSERKEFADISRMLIPPLALSCQQEVWEI